MKLRLGFGFRPEPGVRRFVLKFKFALDGFLFTALAAAIVWLFCWFFAAQIFRPETGFENPGSIVYAMLMGAGLSFVLAGSLLLSMLLLLLLAGRDELVIRPGRVEIYTGIPGIAFGAAYDPRKMQSIGLEESLSGNSARIGNGLGFDYEGSRYRFGSNLDRETAARLAQFIQEAAPNAEGAALTSSGEIRWEMPDPSAPTPGGAAGAPPRVAEVLRMPSRLALIAANVVAIFGALFWGWELHDVVVLYWAEVAIIGFYGVLKFIVADGWMSIFTVLAFGGHFGAFMVLYMIFLELLLGAGAGLGSTVLREFPHFFGAAKTIWPALGALFVSHGVSFVRNFLGQREYERLDVVDLMLVPYARIAGMHVLIVALMFPVVIVGKLFGTITPVLVVLMAAKVCYDLKAHLKERAGWGISAKLRELTG